VDASRERSDEVRAIIDTVAAWAAQQGDVRGVVVVGSWARGTARMDSDVDVVVLSDAHADPGPWTRLLGGQVIRQQSWGPLREIRVRRGSGLEVEVGVAPVSWAQVDPVDPGTRRVFTEGHRIVYDPDGTLAALAAACREAAT
jgi:predicted nucleotidyltransferase